MVALHPVPSDSASLDSSFHDDDLVIALDADGALRPPGAAALLEFAADCSADAWYGDIDIAGAVTLRSGWSPTRLIADPTAATPLAVKAGWLRRNETSPAARDLALRLVRSGAEVAHVTAVLSSHRTAPVGASADDLTRHLRAVGLRATVDDQGRLQPTADFAATVSIVIPTAGATLEDGAVAIDRLLEQLHPVPARFELVIVVGDEFRGDPGLLEGPGRVLVRRPPGAFNFSTAVNLGVLHARSDLVLLLNDDTEPVDCGFVDRMALHLDDESVAAVGALLTYPDGTVQHAGIVIDDARPLHPFVGWEPAATAPHGGLTARDVAAVTGGCMMLRRTDFLAVGGLSTSFPLSFNDVDLCVRLRRAVGRIVMEPAATLVHHETLSREPVISADEWDRWISRWGEIVDPWYHPAYDRPDDPNALARNADHLPPGNDSISVVTARLPRLRSRVHRGRPTPVRR